MASFQPGPLIQTSHSKHYCQYKCNESDEQKCRCDCIPRCELLTYTTCGCGHCRCGHRACVLQSTLGYVVLIVATEITANDTLALKLSGPVSNKLVQVRACLCTHILWHGGVVETVKYHDYSNTTYDLI